MEPSTLRHYPQQPASPIVPLKTVGNITMHAKLEIMNPTGSFKHRGASHKMNLVHDDDPESLKNGVYAASAGNHAQGVAWTASRLGINSYIYVPEKAPERKIEAIIKFGGNVSLVAGGFDAALALAKQHCDTAKGIFIHPFDDPDVIDGQAGVGEEIAAEPTFYDRVFVPVGGGGLLAGTLKALARQSPETLVYGVQLEGADAFSQSYRACAPKELNSVNPISDGTAVMRAGIETVAIALNSHNFAGCLVVSNPELYTAMLAQDELIGYEAEAAGTLAYAGMQRALQEIIKPPHQTENWVGVVSGIHRDPRLFNQLALACS